MYTAFSLQKIEGYIYYIPYIEFKICSVPTSDRMNISIQDVYTFSNKHWRTLFINSNEKGYIIPSAYSVYIQMIFFSSHFELRGIIRESESFIYLCEQIIIISKFKD